MDGAASWAFLGLQDKKVDSPKVSVHVGSEKGEAGYLKKYIYILYTSIRSILCQDRSQARGQ